MNFYQIIEVEGLNQRDALVEALQQKYVWVIFSYEKRNPKIILADPNVNMGREDLVKKLRKYATLWLRNNKIMQTFSPEK